MNVRVRSTNRIGGLLGGIMILIIGSGVLFFGLQLRTWTQNEIATMLPAEGRVVQMVSRTNKGSTQFYPIVEFRTAEGQTIRFQGRTGTNPPSYRVGDTVKVRYDPQTPQSAVIDSWELWLPSGIFIGVGGFFALIGILTILNALAVLLKWGGLIGLLGIILLRQKRV